jgi:hypothetical protein
MPDRTSRSELRRLTLTSAVTMFVLTFAADFARGAPRQPVAERVVVLLVTALLFAAVMYPVWRGVLEHRDRKRAAERDR